MLTGQGSRGRLGHKFGIYGLSSFRGDRLQVGSSTEGFGDVMTAGIGSTRSSSSTERGVALQLIKDFPTRSRAIPNRRDWNAGSAQVADLVIDRPAGATPVRQQSGNVVFAAPTDPGGSKRNPVCPRRIPHTNQSIR